MVRPQEGPHKTGKHLQYDFAGAFFIVALGKVKFPPIVVWELEFAVSVPGSIFSVLRSPFYVLCSSFFIPQNAVGVAYL